MKTVQISVGDDGQVTVGTPEEGGMPGGDAMGGMQTAKSVDEALDMAREILTGNPEQDAQAEADMNAGYESVNKLGMM